MQLPGPEQEALLAPQSGADLLTHASQLATLRPDAVLGVVRVFYQTVPLAGQRQGEVHQLLIEQKTNNGMSKRPLDKTLDVTVCVSLTDNGPIILIPINLPVVIYFD